jgi:hypothetical protein
VARGQRWTTSFAMLTRARGHKYIGCKIRRVIAVLAGEFGNVLGHARLLTRVSALSEVDLP